MLQIVGAGLGRTGTTSLKQALEQLLGGTCYHMVEVFAHPDDIAVWQHAVDGEPPDWRAFFADYTAAVDWPAAAYWREVSDAFPDAPVLLSTREDADAWFTSASNTIFRVSSRPSDGNPVGDAHRAMALSMFEKTFTLDYLDPDVAKRAYEAHNAAVRAEVPADRLIDWQPGDGWAPICERLGVAIPDTPFPHTNTTEEFQAMMGGRRAPE